MFCGRFVIIFLFCNIITHMFMVVFKVTYAPAGLGHIVLCNVAVKTIKKL